MFSLQHTLHKLIAERNLGVLNVTCSAADASLAAGPVLRAVGKSWQKWALNVIGKGSLEGSVLVTFKTAYPATSKKKPRCKIAKGLTAKVYLPLTKAKNTDRLTQRLIPNPFRCSTGFTQTTAFVSFVLLIVTIKKHSLRIAFERQDMRGDTI